MILKETTINDESYSIATSTRYESKGAIELVRKALEIEPIDSLIFTLEGLRNSVLMINTDSDYLPAITSALPDPRINTVVYGKDKGLVEDVKNLVDKTSIVDYSERVPN